MKSFLVVEDDKRISRLCEELINSKYDDAIVVHASNGKEALQKIGQLDYTAIITDLKMPTMDGEEFYKRLKQQSPHLAKRLALVSAYVDTPRASYFLEDGCQCLMKPFTIKEFYGLLDSIVGVVVEKFERNHGRICMRKDVRFSLAGKCLLKSISSGLTTKRAVHAEMIDHSEGGLAIEYVGTILPTGTLLKTFAEPLDIVNKEAKIVWSKCLDGSCRSGLQWV